MKLHFFLQIVLGILIARDSLSFGQILSYESFSGKVIGVGPFDPSGGSYGWTSSWDGSGLGENRFLIFKSVSQLSFQVLNGDLISGGDRALMVTTTPEPTPASMEIVRRFSARSEFYLGFLLQVPVIGTGTDQININLLNGSVAPISISLRPSNLATNFPTLGVYTAFNGGNRQLTGGPSKVHYIVFQFRNKNFSLWMDPNTETSPVTSGSSVDFASQINGISISTKSIDSSGLATTAIVDEIRIAETWAAILGGSSPEPSAPPLPRNYAVLKTGLENVGVRWLSDSGFNYQLQNSFDLSTWTNMGSPIAGDGQFQEVVDAVSGNPTKYYRIVVY